MRRLNKSIRIRVRKSTIGGKKSFLFFRKKKKEKKIELPNQKIKIKITYPDKFHRTIRSQFYDLICTPLPQSSPSVSIALWNSNNLRKKEKARTRASMEAERDDDEIIY
jgi:hypothetical protein